MKKAPKKGETVAKKKKVQSVKQVLQEKQTEKEAKGNIGVMNAVKMRGWWQWVALGLIVVVVGLFMGRDWVIAATVNGKPIWRWSVIKSLEKQGGKQVLDSLVTKELILQKARNEGVEVTEEELTAEVEKVEAQLGEGVSLEERLAVEGMSVEELKAELKVQKAVEKLLGADDEVGDDEIGTFLEENSDFLPEEASSEELVELARQQLQSQKRQKRLQEWIQTVHDEAKIGYWVNW